MPLRYAFFRLSFVWCAQRSHRNIYCLSLSLSLFRSRTSFLCFLRFCAFPFSNHSRTNAINRNAMNPCLFCKNSTQNPIHSHGLDPLLIWWCLEGDNIDFKLFLQIAFIKSLISLSKSHNLWIISVSSIKYTEFMCHSQKLNLWQILIIIPTSVTVNRRIVAWVFDNLMHTLVIFDCDPGICVLSESGAHWLHYVCVAIPWFHL